MVNEAGLKTLWQQLEGFAAMRPLASLRCRYCDRQADAGAPLCPECDARRLELKERFDVFPIPPNAAEDDAELERQVDRPDAPRIRITPPAERLPYKDPEDN